MTSERDLGPRFERLESKLLLTCQLVNTEVQLLHHSELHGWYLDRESLRFAGHDALDAWEPVATGDFTADGITDVLGQVAGGWWLGVNDGTQLFGIPWGEQLPFDTEIIGKGDFNNDGWLDILARNAGSGDFWLARNSKDGFVTENWGQLSNNVGWSDFFLRDFDDDGLIDVLARETTAGNWWLAKNHGSGFRNQHWGRLPDFPWRNVIAGDFDGDSFGDIAARAENNTWWVWRGTDAGLRPSEYWGHWKIRGNWHKDVEVADFDGDGRDDVMGRSYDDRLWVGISTDAEFHTSAWTEPWSGLAGWTDVRVVDFDGDGIQDVVGRVWDDTYWVARSTGQDMKIHAWGKTVGNAGYVAYVTDFQSNEGKDVSDLFPGIEEELEDPVTPGDAVEINRQSYQTIQADLLKLANPLGEMSVQLLHYTPGRAWIFGSANQPDRRHDVADEWTPLLTGDFNSDGRTDILGTVEDDWWLQLNDGTELSATPWGEGLPSGMNILGTADFNDDGWLDVLAWDAVTGEFWVARNSGSGFVSAKWGQFSNKVRWSDFVLRDFDNDGLVDVMAREPAGNWWLAKNHGNGFHNHHWGRLPDFDWLDVVHGDFDGDQLGDVAARAPDNTWWVWRGTETGLQFSEYWGHWRMRQEWHDVMVGDFNGDGRDDLIGQTYNSALWVGISSESKFVTTTWSDGRTGLPDWSDARVIDVDADGAADLVGRSHDNRFWVAKNTGEEIEVYYWRNVGRDGFVDYVSGLTAHQAPNVPHQVPVDEQIDLVVTLDGRLVSEDMRVTLNDDGRLVISGSVRDVIGIDLQSPSGSLIPIAGGDSASPEPFSFLLANKRHQVTLGNLRKRLDLSGELVLDVGWDVTTGVRDLRVWFGRATGINASIEATVDEALFHRDEDDCS